MAKKWEEARAACEAKLDGLQKRLTGAVETLGLLKDGPIDVKPR